MNQPLDEVMARWEKDGSIVPLHFTWKGQTRLVDSVGRSWRDEQGWHILCMAGGSSVYELILNPDLRWEIRPPAGPIPG